MTSGADQDVVDAEQLGLAHAPRPQHLASIFVPELSGLLQYQDVDTLVSQEPGQGRTGDTATDDDYIELQIIPLSQMRR